MKGKSDPTFPSEQAFRRVGNKSELAKKLLAYCENKPGYESIAQICKPLIVSAATQPTRVKLEAVAFGEVYLLKAGKYYKIGRSNAAGRREYELSIQLPEKPTIVHVLKTDDPVGIELYWHRRFEKRHKNGEWFELTPEDVVAFKRRKFM